MAKKTKIQIETCAEAINPSEFGIFQNGCINKNVIEKACGFKLIKNCGVQNLRENCNCIPMSDIGAYNSCPHLCRYCYANYDAELVHKNISKHNPESSFLLGNAMQDDIFHKAKQKVLRDASLENQLELQL